jgi:hypothetical protein
MEACAILPRYQRTYRRLDVEEKLCRSPNSLHIHRITSAASIFVCCFAMHVAEKAIGEDQFICSIPYGYTSMRCSVTTNGAYPGLRGILK